MYIVIRRDPDGDVDVHSKTKKELQDYLNDEEYFDPAFCNIISENEFEGESSPQYWKGEEVLLIIKGDVVVPKIKKVVKEWEVE